MSVAVVRVLSKLSQCNGGTLNEPLNVTDYQEYALKEGSEAQAICILALNDDDGNKYYGGYQSEHNHRGVYLDNCCDQSEAELEGFRRFRELGCFDHVFLNLHNFDAVPLDCQTDIRIRNGF